MVNCVDGWEDIYRQGGEIFRDIHPDMHRIVSLFKEYGVRKILDLGCGSGRHVVYFARLGFEVYGFDSSSTAVRLAREWLRREGVDAYLKVWDMFRDFPYDNDFFDAVISIQVIHHGTSFQVKKVIREIERVLKASGLIFVTVPKRILRKRGEYYYPIPRSDFYSKFIKVEERVFIPTDGLEKGIPHFYFNKRLIKEYFSNFKLLDIHVDVFHHYCILGVLKKPSR